MMNETTFADVQSYLANPANYPTARERAAQRRETARLEAQHARRAAELGISVEEFVSGAHLFAGF